MRGPPTGSYRRLGSRAAPSQPMQAKVVMRFGCEWAGRIKDATRSHRSHIVGIRQMGSASKRDWAQSPKGRATPSNGERGSFDLLHQRLAASLRRCGLARPVEECVKAAGKCQAECTEASLKAALIWGEHPPALDALRPFSQPRLLVRERCRGANL